MNVKIADSWNPILSDEFESDYFENLISFVNTEYCQHTCFPKKEEIFAAFDYCSFQDVKVVIIGQDPYHGVGQANGLCFSVKENMAIPPSLRNIFKEIRTDIAIPIPENGNLERWAKQGVLLLNSTLTVRAHEAGSHQKKGWENFTDAVISKISDRKKEVVFLLWGGYARKKAKLIDSQKHHVLTSGHPSPLSANRGYWFDNKHFSSANSFLSCRGLQTINW